MEERTDKTIKKSLIFETGGEMLSVEICIKNIPPGVSKNTIIPMLDTLFEKIKESMV